MVNPDILVKLRWVVFVALGVCLMVSPALAEVTPAVEEDSNGSLTPLLPLRGTKVKGEYHGGMKFMEGI